MADLTFFQYGGFTHPEGEVKLVRHEVIPALSKRGLRWGDYHRFHLEIELVASGTALQTAVNDLINAYSVNDQKAQLVLPNGTITNHVLDPSDPLNYSGVKVIQRSWDKSDPSEWVNARTHSVVLQSLYKNPDSGILWYEDNILIVGDGGPMWSWFTRPSGPPIQKPISEETIQLVLQSGAVYAIDFFPRGNVPPPVLPAWERRWRRRVGLIYPEYKGTKFYNHGVSWRYEMATPPGTAIPDPALRHFPGL